MVKEEAILQNLAQNVYNFKSLKEGDVGDYINGW